MCIYEQNTPPCKTDITHSRVRGETPFIIFFPFLTKYNLSCCILTIRMLEKHKTKQNNNLAASEKWYRELVQHW